MRSTWSGTIEMGNKLVPIALFKAADPFSISTNRYHSGCGGSVKQPMTCEIHPEDDISNLTYLGVKYGEQVIEVSDSERKRMTGGDAPLKVVAARKLSEVRQKIGTELFFCEPYMVGSPSVNESVKAVNEMVLSSLLDRLAKRGQCLIVKFPNGIERFGVLFASGYLFPLLYTEEVREPAMKTRNPQKDLTPEINNFLDGLSVGDFPDLTIEPVLTRVNNWFKAQIKALAKPKIGSSRTSKKKSEKGVVTTSPTR